MEVIGVLHSHGQYDGKSFDNYNIYVRQEENERLKNCVFGNVPMNFNAGGKQRSYLKVKASVLHEVVAPDKIEKLIGRDINCSLDVYGNVTKVEVIKE